MHWLLLQLPLLPLQMVPLVAVEEQVVLQVQAALMAALAAVALVLQVQEEQQAQALLVQQEGAALAAPLQAAVQPLLLQQLQRAVQPCAMQSSCIWPLS